MHSFQFTISTGCNKVCAPAGLGPGDIDVAQIYDCFTPVVLIELEDLGFCDKGAAGGFVEDGNTALDGALPMNTNGGLLSYCHPGNPGSLYALTEAVFQLRHAAGDRLLADAEGIILDLRRNPGGYLDESLTLADLFLERNQLIATTRCNSGPACRT